MYKVVTGEIVSEFEAEVISLIKKGWSLQGGVSIIEKIGSGRSFAQAMVRHNRPVKQGIMPTKILKYQQFLATGIGEN
jgi:hypothetical protein